MKIWLINPYGPIPSEGWRDYCYTMMGRALADAGHDVVWWTSSFSHHFKRFRCDGWADVAAGERFTIRLVPSPGYQRNIGVGRILRDLVFSWRTYRRARGLERPDLIVYSESPLSLGYAGQKLAAAFDCPVIYHQMDLWPELIVAAFPKPLRAMAALAFAPVYARRRQVYRQLSAATGLASRYLDVVLREAPALRQQPHAVVYNGIDVTAFRQAMSQPSAPLPGLPDKRPADVWAVFAGSLGPSYDIPTLWRAAQQLESSDSPVHIVIAGDGPYRQELEHRCASPSNTRLHYLGKLAPSQLAVLYAQCDIGLCAYSDHSNVEMPDKIYDYTAAGLPVINSLKGEVSDVIRQQAIGLQYRAGDVGDLLHQLRSISDDRSALAAMAERSRRQGAVYDQHVQYAKMTELIESVVAKSRGAVCKHG